MTVLAALVCQRPRWLTGHRKPAWGEAGSAVTSAMPPASGAPDRSAWLSGRRHPLLGQPVVVVLAWLLTRGWALAAGRGYLPYPAPEATLSDISLYLYWAPGLAAGTFPDDVMWQYPPGAGPILALLSPLTGAGLDSVTAFALLMLPADLLLLVLLIAVGPRRGAGWDGMLPAWLWVLAGPVIGPIMFGRFDLVPALLAAAGVIALGGTTPRPGWAGALFGLGALVKVWPAFLLLAVPKRNWPQAVLGAVIAGGTGTLVIAAAYGGIGGFLGNQAARGLQVESVAALPFVIARAQGAPVEFPYQYGALEVSSPGTGPAALLATLVLIVGLGGLLLAGATGRLAGVPVGDTALLVTLIAVVGSRVYSPQFMVWLCALAATAALDRRTLLAGPMVLVGACAGATQMVYPWLYGPLLDGQMTGVAVQATRVGLLLAATIWAVAAVARAGRPPVGGPPLRP